MTKLSTVLVANRGEIALRIMRTARALGLRSVAVFSDPDAQAPHVLFADRAVRLGPGPVGESYLRGDAIIAAAKAQGAEAIHPGYGLLSENAEFAQAVADAGLIFIGPSPSAIALMGDKAKAKRRMLEAGVPCIPGYEGEAQGEEHFIAAAGEIGFPVMVKAAAGGGGRGMRLVHDPDELPNALQLARAEAENAFGSGDLILEKAIVSPRHVEVQVFADAAGNTVYLGERDCSVQRRHQKIIEEAPCPVMTPALRERMGTAAVEAARAVNYQGAGTVEFLLDVAGEFYFLEMNTRLQVEHPVTEFITGLDLVALQLRVAQGAGLGFEQADVVLDGHAMEVRLYAEDPSRDFLPCTGPVLLWSPPEGDGVRVDAGIATDGEVSPFYDSMVAKIITHGASREEARRRLVRALHNTALFGFASNRDFLIDALAREAFVNGSATTAFIEETYGELGFSPDAVDPPALAAAAVIQHRLAQEQANAAALGVSRELLDWSSDGGLSSVREYVVGADHVHVSVAPVADEQYSVRVGQVSIKVLVKSEDAGSVSLQLDDEQVHARFLAESARTLHFSLGGRCYAVTDTSAGVAGEEETAGTGTVTAPMHGLVLSLAVAEGDVVNPGDKLAVLEAMKMQHEIVADVAGTVVEVGVSADTQIAADDLIMRIEPATAG